MQSSSSMVQHQIQHMLRHTRVLPKQHCRYSHIGSRPIPIPASISCTLDNFSASTCTASSASTSSPIQPRRRSRNPTQSGNAQSSGTIRLSGPLGSHSFNLPPGITATIEDLPSSSSKQLLLGCNDSQSRKVRAQYGLSRALLANAALGVEQGHKQTVRLVGVGYRAAIEENNAPQAAGSSPSNKQLVLRLGYPKPVRITVPESIQCSVSSPTEIGLVGQDKAVLGQFAASIRAWRPPEPYNGKGVFVGSETIRRKEVKKK